MNKPNTYFLDIDGTLFFFEEDMSVIITEDKLQVLPCVRQKTQYWHSHGSKIVIITARPESMREITCKQLANAGIVFDHLIMGLGTGARVLVNDLDPLDPSPKAIAINVVRNSGLDSVI